MSAVRGWCPGAIKPMLTGDGLLVRLRVTGGILSAVQARKIAQLSARYGNGLVDLSSRANLQLRGVGAKTLEALQDELGALGLLDTDETAEAVRNVIASPLAGLDPTAMLDIRPLVRELEDALTKDTALHRLPAKFGFVIDDGGMLSLRDVVTDIGFEAISGAEFMVSLAGQPVTHCQAADLVAVGTTLASTFLAHRRTETRMRDLVERIGVDTLQQPSLRAKRGNPQSSRNNGLPRFARNDGLVMGVGVKFGRMTAKAFGALAAETEGELRLSPFRAVFLTKMPAQLLPEIETRLTGYGFILDDADPLRAIAACAGAPACLSATTSVQTDASYLAGLGIALHVSGCSKGCAYPGSSPVTLVGRDGRYDLVWNGTAKDAPALSGLDLAQVEQALTR